MRVIVKPRRHPNAGEVSLIQSGFASHAKTLVEVGIADKSGIFARYRGRLPQPQSADKTAPDSFKDSAGRGFWA
jgi:hypothetical protein